MRILFVCQGNVARSQMAEAYYNYFTKSDNASSAGVLDFTPAKYRHPTKEVIQLMKEEGLDVSQQIVKFITKEMVDNANKIFVICKKEECPIFLLNSGKITFWNINDPYNTSLEKHQIVRDEIKKHIKQLIKETSVK